MLKIYDKDHNAIGHLVKYKDCKVEGDVATGDKSLSFTYLAKHHSLANEMYVRTRDDEYVIKEVSESSDGFPQIVAALNLEGLEAEAWQTASFTDITVDEGARTILAGTGWTVGECNVTKRRNAGMMQVSSLGAIQGLCTAFMCEPVFDTINKKVSFYEKRGGDKGVYFMSGLNLRKLQKKSSSYDFYTRIIPVGADGLTIESVNGGKNYLENYQYSNKVRTYIWKDENYTDAQALKEDAEKKLEDLSKPEVSYSADVRDLAKQKPGYSILSYKLGDTVTLVDQDTGTREKQRIMRTVEYEDDPGKNTCEIANTFLTFEEMQEKLRAAAELAGNTITGDGKIYVSNILNWEKGLSESITVGGIQENLSAMQGNVATMQGDIETMQGDIAEVKAKFGELDVNFLTAEEAAIKYAAIDQLNATNETVHSIQGDYADFKTLTAKEFAAQSGIIDNLSGQFSSYQTQMSQELIAAKGWMLEGAIGDAQISNVSANKLTSGSVDTAIVTVTGSGGHLQIIDNTIQISDDAHVRVQAGKDASGDYTLAVWDSEGKLIWDALGATENTIQRKIIRDKMVADDAGIQAMKIDFREFNTVLNDQTVSISGTVVQVGNKTLNVALSEQEDTITEQGKTLVKQQGQIEANEKAISLMVDNQTYQADKEAMQSSLNKATSNISVLQGQIALKVEQTDIDTAVKKVDGKFSSYSTTAQMQSAINAAKDSITSTVSSTYATKSEVGTVSGKVTSLESWRAEASQKITKEGIIATVGNYYVNESDLAGIEDRVSTAETMATQTADKFNWIVKSGTSAADFTLTDRTATLVAQTISLNGDVKVSGDMLVDGAVTSEKISTDAIKSRNYIYESGKYSEAGTFLDLANGAIRSKNFGIDEEGNAYFSGNLSGATGSFLGDVTAKSITVYDELRMKDSLTGDETRLITVEYDIIDEDYKCANITIATDAQQDELTIAMPTYFYGEVGIVGGGSLLARNSDIYCKNLYATTAYSDNWFRSHGNTGWYSEDYGGGWYMLDTAWVRSYNQKGVYTGAGNFYTEGGKYISGQHSGSWIGVLQGEAGLNVQSAGASTGFNGLARVKCTSGAWAIGALNSNNYFYLAYAKQDRLNSGTNGADLMWGFGTDGSTLPPGSIKCPKGHGLYSSTTNTNLIRQGDMTNFNNCTVISTTSVPTSIYTNGQVWKNGSSSTYFATTSSSDKRLKEYVGDMSGYEAVFMKLLPVAFRYHDGLYNAPKSKPLIQWGFFAQDVIQAFKENGIDWQGQELVVVEDGDLTEEEKKYVSPGTLLKMNYQNLTALNTHMIQKNARGILEMKAAQNDQAAILSLVAARQDTQEARIESLQYQLNEARGQIAQQAEEIARMKGMLQAVA